MRNKEVLKNFEKDNNNSNRFTNKIGDKYDLRKLCREAGFKFKDKKDAFS